MFKKIVQPDEVMCPKKRCKRVIVILSSYFCIYNNILLCHCDDYTVLNNSYDDSNIMHSFLVNYINIVSIMLWKYILLPVFIVQSYTNFSLPPGQSKLCGPNVHVLNWIFKLPPWSTVRLLILPSVPRKVN